MMGGHAYTPPLDSNRDMVRQLTNLETIRVCPGISGNDLLPHDATDAEIIGRQYWNYIQHGRILYGQWRACLGGQVHVNRPGGSRESTVPTLPAGLPAPEATTTK